MMQAENIFTCFKIDTLIINRVYYKVGQLQYLVRALNGNWQTTVNVMQNFVD